MSDIDRIAETAWRKFAAMESFNTQDFTSCVRAALLEYAAIVREKRPTIITGDGWRVEVFRHGEQVVAIEPEMLTGRDLSPEDELLIEACAYHLLGFVGK